MVGLMHTWCIQNEIHLAHVFPTSIVSLLSMSGVYHVLKESGALRNTNKRRRPQHKQLRLYMSSVNRYSFSPDFVRNLTFSFQICFCRLSFVTATGCAAANNGSHTSVLSVPTRCTCFYSQPSRTRLYLIEYYFFWVRSSRCTYIFPRIRLPSKCTHLWCFQDGWMDGRMISPIIHYRFA